MWNVQNWKPHGRSQSSHTQGSSRDLHRLNVRDLHQLGLEDELDKVASGSNPNAETNCSSQLQMVSTTLPRVRCMRIFWSSKWLMRASSAFWRHNSAVSGMGLNVMNIDVIFCCCEITAIVEPKLVCNKDFKATLKQTTDMSWRVA